jgi:protein-L-isoaspartate(D-aspartate) O-methyltransferase
MAQPHGLEATGLVTLQSGTATIYDNRRAATQREGGGVVGTATQLHQRLVDQLAGNGLLDNPRLRAAFEAVPREHFLPGVAVERVYQDDAVTCHSGPDGTPLSSSSQPTIMATMLGQLDPQPGDHVLEIGAGSGYNAALLAQLVAPGGQVTSIELDPEVAAAARANLARVGVDGVAVHTGDGWLGVPEQGPFDRIEVTVGVRDLAPTWSQQLTTAGVLVAPLALHASVHVSVGFAPYGRHLHSRSVEGCGFLPLRGPHASAKTFAKVQPGLWASLEDATDATLTVLGELLAATPTREPVPGLPEGWFARLALSAPAAIQLLPAEGERWELEEVSGGLLDPAADGLGLVLEQARQLIGFGDPAPLAALRRHLATSRPLDLGSLEIQAVPAELPDEAPPEVDWVIARQAHRFWIREPQARDVRRARQLSGTPDAQEAGSEQA